MANKIMYQIVGRYMDGKEVVAYHMVSPETGKSQKFTKEQTYFLVGKGSVTNCSGQIYQDKVLLRGIGCDLNSLPVQDVSGQMQRTSSVGHIRRGDTAEDVMSKMNAVKAIVQGRNTVGYILQNNGGGTLKVSRQKMFELAKAGKLGNVRCQESNGKLILRGVGIKLSQLPTESIDSDGNASTPAPANLPKSVENASMTDLKPSDVNRLKAAIDQYALKNKNYTNNMCLYRLATKISKEDNSSTVSVIDRTINMPTVRATIFDNGDVSVEYTSFYINNGNIEATGWKNIPVEANLTTIAKTLLRSYRGAYANLEKITQ